MRRAFTLQMHDQPAIKGHITPPCPECGGPTELVRYEIVEGTMVHTLTTGAVAPTQMRCTLVCIKPGTDHGTEEFSATGRVVAVE